MPLPETWLSKLLDGFILAVGRWMSWLWLLLLAVIVVNVTMRYLFGEGRIEFEEIQWHFYAVGFLFGLSYAYVSDAHIRVDVVRVRLSPVTQAWIELYGTLLLLLPFIALVIIYSVPFIGYSYATGEVSEAPGGLGFRWVIKSMLLVGFGLLLIAVVSRLSRIFAFLFGWPESDSGQMGVEDATR